MSDTDKRANPKRVQHFSLRFGNISITSCIRETCRWLWGIPSRTVCQLRMLQPSVHGCIHRASWKEYAATTLHELIEILINPGRGRGECLGSCIEHISIHFRGPHLAGGSDLLVPILDYVHLVKCECVCFFVVLVVCNQAHRFKRLEPDC